MTSTHLGVPDGGDLGPLVDQAERYAAVGLDLGIVYLPPPHTPAVLEPVADGARAPRRREQPRLAGTAARVPGLSLRRPPRATFHISA